MFSLFSSSSLPLDRSDLFTETGAYKPDEGALLKEGDEGKIMIGSYYKYNNVFSKPVRIRDKITINGMQFEVKSVLQPIGNPGDDRNIYLPLDDSCMTVGLY